MKIEKVKKMTDLEQKKKSKRVCRFIEFKDQVHIDKTTGFVDGYISSTKVLIEQKILKKI